MNRNNKRAFLGCHLENPSCLQNTLRLLLVAVFDRPDLDFLNDSSARTPFGFLDRNETPGSGISSDTDCFCHS